MTDPFDDVAHTLTTHSALLTEVDRANAALRLAARDLAEAEISLQRVARAADDLHDKMRLLTLDNRPIPFQLRAAADAADRKFVEAQADAQARGEVLRAAKVGLQTALQRLEAHVRTVELRDSATRFDEIVGKTHLAFTGIAGAALGASLQLVDALGITSSLWFSVTAIVAGLIAYAPQLIAVVLDAKASRSANARRSFVVHWHRGIQHWRLLFLLATALGAVAAWVTLLSKL